MSSIAITGGATGTGVFSLVAPSTSTNRTINLPDSNGTILTSATTKGFPAGSVLQVVSSSTSTSVSTSSTAFVDTGVTATITPTSASSKIFIIVTHNGLVKTSGNVGNGINIKLLRGATDLGTLINALMYTATALDFRSSASLSAYDSPATTSATTYKTQFANISNAAAVLVNEGPATSTITLMEIAA